MKINKLGIMLVVLLGLVGVLVGCDEGEFVVDADFGEEVESVGVDETEEVLTNDTESESTYYKEAETFINTSMEFIRATFETINQAQVNDANKDELINETNDFILFVQTFDATPITEADKLMHENLIEAKYDIERVAHYTLQYIYKGDNSYRSLHKDHFDNFRIHLKTLSEIESKYYQ